MKKFINICWTICWATFILVGLGWLASCIFGCASLGQYPAAHTGAVTTAQRVMIPRATFGHSMLREMYTPTTAIFTVQNGTSDVYVAQWECLDLTEYTIELPPYTAQQITIVTTLSNRDLQLCSEIE